METPIDSHDDRPEASFADRWELGSELHQVDLVPRAPGSPRSPWEQGAVTWAGAGRDGIRLLLHYGARSRGWERCWLPSYLCQEVVSAARSTGLRCALYPWNPLEPTRVPRLDLGASDVLMAVHQFGLSDRPEWLDAIPATVDVIEDHTHDPWSAWARASTATYAFASLRKTLPVAEGTPIWSPRGLPLPPEPALTEVRARAAALKHEGMAGKASYLAGGSVTKDEFRASLSAGESEIASGEISGISALSRDVLREFPTWSWRATRLRNAQRLRERLRDVEGVELLEWAADATPFSAILVLPRREERDRLRAHLIASHVYPAILWPVAEAELEGITELDLSLADRLLSIHCDGRYNEADMDRLAEVIVAGLVP